MSTFVESLKRLYKAGQITGENLDRLAEQGKIDSEALAVIKQSAEAE